MEETLTKVVLTRVYTSDEKKDGTKFIDKNGKPFKRVAVQTNAHGETWLSCFSFNADDEMRTWEVGKEVQILISKNGDFLNFKMPRKVDLLEDRVAKLEEWRKSLGNGQTPAYEEPAVDVNKSDLPF